MTNYVEAMKQVEAQARAEGKDVAVAKKRWRAADGSREEMRAVDVQFLEPGTFPKVFPGPTTDADREAGEQWDEAWTIHRCAPQPARTRISLPAGKFIPTGLPDIKIDR